MATTTRIKKAFTAIPTSITSAVAYIASIASKQREINKINREAKAKADEIYAKAKLEVQKLEGERRTFFDALYAFAASKKSELTADNCRSHKTEAGAFGWRWTPPSVAVDEGLSDEVIIKILEQKKLLQYVRVIKELDREAMLRGKPQIDGVSYTQRDEFFVKPKLGKEDGRAVELTKTEQLDV